jgi:hypothetical protein
MSATPEPSSLALMGTGILGIAFAFWKRLIGSLGRPRIKGDAVVRRVIVPGKLRMVGLKEIR